MSFGNATSRRLSAALAIIAYCAPSVAQGSPLTPAMPVARRFAGAALDLITGRAVMFGGVAAAAANQLWELDGAQWHLRPSVGPTPNGSGINCFDYDFTRLRFVAYDAFSSATWEHDGVAWSLRPTSVTPGGPAYGMVFDGTRSLLLSEQAGQYVLWGWDGTAWSLVAPSGPARSSGPPAMGFDALRGEVLLFGGSRFDALTGRVMPTDTLHRWSLLTSTWSTVPVGPNWPQARSEAAFAFDLGRGVMVLHGGLGGFFNDTDLPTVSEWNGASWSPAQSAPAMRGHALVWSPARSAMLTIGGDTGQVHAWNGTQWQLVVGQGARVGQVVDAGSALLGVNLLDNVHPSVSRWQDNAWRPLEQAPAPATFGGAVAFDVARGVLVGFADAFGVTLEWTAATGWVQPVVPGPSARTGAAMTYDPLRRRVVLFGGNAISPVGPLGDTWEYDGTSWTQRVLTTSPSPRAFAAMGFDPVTQRVILVGPGASAFSLQTNTWSTMPVPVVGQSGFLALDRATNNVVYYNRSDGALSRWNGTTWLAAGVAFSGDFVAGVGSDPADNSLLVLTPESHSPALRVGSFAGTAVAVIGSGCSAGAPPVLVADAPWLGNPAFELRARGIGINGPCVFGIATSNVAQPFGGCTLQLGGALSLFDTVANSSGIASLTLAIPRTPALRGAVVFAQAGTAGPLGFALTHALRLTVGD